MMPAAQRTVRPEAARLAAALRSLPRHPLPHRLHQRLLAIPDAQTAAGVPSPTPARSLAGTSA